MAIDLNILIGGAAGQGVHAITLPLAKALVRQGAQVLFVQDYQSRIRGGHLFNQIRVADRPLMASREGVDLLVALNQETVTLHQAELSPEGVIIYDAARVKELPAGRPAVALTHEALLPGTQAGEIAVNAGACGAVLGLFKASLAPLLTLLTETFADKGAQVVEWNLKAATRGYELAKTQGFRVSLAYLTPPSKPRLLISGHEALALGALAAGLNFISGYPMTPWTSVLNTIGQRAVRWGVVVEQAEDEIAAINMAIGASYAGARAMTGTSGGGFCLMTEALGLAAMTETPLVIVEAMRPGPSTGLPTRTEQGDLSFVLYAGQGDSPRAVLAPGTPAQGFALAVKAFHLAERYQIPVFLLTDQYFGDTQFTHTASEFPEVQAQPAPASGPASDPYERYAFTESGISPRRLPGFGPQVVVADSDEHTPDGHLTEDLTVRVKMHDKRLRKLETLVQELNGITTVGAADAPLTLACWGSSLGPVAEAVDRLNESGTPARLVHLSELWPFPRAVATAALSGTKKLVLVEMNATGQLNRLLRQETGLAADHLVLKYDGTPFTPEYILKELKGHI
ncbi:MAG: 2-oxoacid:acceptor oxidoreductase subunit alpha [Desulfobaccales bacterium]|nr:2-oxoacid:acceptor oxidoreductase subunit alpha [Desulfobaccales bacterium]